LIPLVVYQFEFLTDFFLNPFNWIMLVIFLLVGMIIAILLYPRTGKDRVLKLDVDGKRFVELPIVEESSLTLECEAPKGMPEQRFWKYWPGYTGIVGRFLKRPATVFLGRMGNAFTWKTSAKDVPMSLKDALFSLWGEVFYAQIPEAQRLLIEQAQIGVTVALDETKAPTIKDPEKGTERVLTEEDIWVEQDRQAAKTWWEGVKSGQKKDVITWMFIFLAGMGAMAIISKLLGWW
jgi:hypothetical protein